MKDQHKTSGKKLFVSDAHLGGFDQSRNKQIELELIHLIDYCEENDFDIHILGDLFDYWMEYPGHNPDLGKSLLQRFEAYNSKTGATLYITGNHDNWTNGYFNTLGFDLEMNHRHILLNGEKALLMHGDGLADPSFKLSRPLFHRLLRNSKFVKAYQTVLPPKAGLSVMKVFSRLARMRENSETEKKLNKWAEKELKTKDTGVIICGHDHVPRILSFDFGTFINLGTFYQHRSMAAYNNSKLSLVMWDEEARQLKPFYPDS